MWARAVREWIFREISIFCQIIAKVGVRNRDRGEIRGVYTTRLKCARNIIKRRLSFSGGRAIVPGGQKSSISRQLRRVRNHFILLWRFSSPWRLKEAISLMWAIVLAFNKLFGSGIEPSSVDEVWGLFTTELYCYC